MDPRLNALLTKAEDENRAAEALTPDYDAEKVASNAAFYKRWSKGKPIRRNSSGSRFWTCGRNMTQIDFKMAEALAAGGYAILSGNAKEAGATLTMVKK